METIVEFNATTSFSINGDVRVIKTPVKATGNWKIVTTNGTDPKLYIEVEFPIKKKDNPKRFSFFKKNTNVDEPVKDIRFMHESRLEILTTFINKCSEPG